MWDLEKEWYKAERVRPFLIEATEEDDSKWANMTASTGTAKRKTGNLSEATARRFRAIVAGDCEWVSTAVLDRLFTELGLHLWMIGEPDARTTRRVPPTGCVTNLKLEAIIARSGPTCQRGHERNRTNTDGQGECRVCRRLDRAARRRVLTIEAFRRSGDPIARAIENGQTAIYAPKNMETADVA
jgi:hypothetical protein